MIPLTEPFAKKDPIDPAFNVKAFPPPEMDVKLISPPVVPDVMDLTVEVPVSVNVVKVIVALLV